MNKHLSAFCEPDFPANILCVDHFPDLSGAQRSLLGMLPAFSERGWRPSVAFPGEAPFRAMVRSRGYRTHSFACGRYANRNKPLAPLLKYAVELPSLVNSLAELVEGNEIDVLYVNGPRLVAPAAWVAWRTGTPLVFHCHHPLQQQAAIALAGQALELASARVIACSQCAADPLREYVEPERLRVVYNGTADMATGSLRSRGEIRRIGVVGRVEEAKGQLEFVRAAKLVSAQNPDCRFAIIGSPRFSGTEYYGKVIAASEDLPIDFMGWQENMSRVYSDLDLLVVPSRASDASTRVILEALSAGLPVVAFRVGGIPEILKDEQTGFLAEAATVEALAGRILSVARMDRASLDAVVKRARTEWSLRFTVKAYRNSVCNTIAQALRPEFRSYRDELRSPA